MIIDLGPLTIKLDVLIVQIINMTILYYLFKKLFGNTLINEVAKRREQTQKLKLAQKEYDEMIQKAQKEKDELIAEAIKHKDHLIAEGVLIAQKEKNQILVQAQNEAGGILAKANQKADVILQELEHNWLDSVKRTAGLVVKNIFKKDINLQEEYIKLVIDDIKKK